MTDIEIVGEADNGMVALAQIAERKPDLVLLDLQMPGMGGLEVVRKLEHGVHMPLIIIVTAYDKYALQAFEAGAVDYLLKPVGQERLADAVERARRVGGHEAGALTGNLRPVFRSASQENRRKSGRGIFSFERGRGFRVSSRRRHRLDLYAAKEIRRNDDLEGPSGTTGQFQISPDSSERPDQRRPCPQDERAEQSTLAHHAEQWPGVYRQQTAGPERSRASESVAVGVGPIPGPRISGKAYSINHNPAFLGRM